MRKGRVDAPESATNIPGASGPGVYAALIFLAILLA